MSDFKYIPAWVPPEALAGDVIQPGDPRYGIVWQNPDRLSGALCFFGTRVPVQALFDSVEAGDSIYDFLDGFPPITREHVLAVLALAKRNLSPTGKAA